MDTLDVVARALPAAGEPLRRRFWRDREFRGICEDYRDALEAVTRFAGADPARAQEYQEIAAELLAEVRKALEAGRS